MEAIDFTTDYRGIPFQIVLKRRHTRKLDLPMEISHAIERCQVGMTRLEDRIANLQEVPLAAPEDKQLLFDLFR